MYEFCFQLLRYLEKQHSPVQIIVPLSLINFQRLLKRIVYFDIVSILVQTVLISYQF